MYCKLPGNGLNVLLQVSLPKGHLHESVLIKFLVLNAVVFVTLDKNRAEEFGLFGHVFGETDTDGDWRLIEE